LILAKFKSKFKKQNQNQKQKQNQNQNQNQNLTADYADKRGWGKAAFGPWLLAKFKTKIKIKPYR
jgi:hypothetical protein